jgi:hypothetical protein
MYLQLWRHRYSEPDTLVWDQKLSGIAAGSEDVAYNTTYEGQYYFKVNIVPEPSTALCLVAALGCLLGTLKRRRA